MTRRIPLLLPAVLLACAGPVAVAQADNGTLVSGYSGPGGGEQVILGSKLLPAKHGSGGLRAAAPKPAAVAPVATLAPTPTTTTPSAAARRPSSTGATTRRRRSQTSKGAGSHRPAAGRTVRPTTTTPAPASTTTAAPAAAPQVRRVAYPTARASGGTLPFGRTDVIWAFVAAGLLAAVAAATLLVQRQPAPPTAR